MSRLIASWQKLSPRQRQLFIIWSLLLLALYAWLTISGIRAQRHLIAEQHARHAARMGTDGASKTEPAKTPPPGHEQDVPKQVKVGMYVDRISSLGFAEAHWSVDFLIWFSWQDKELNPGETFTVVGGEIAERTEITRLEHEGTFYARYRVAATITKHFDASRFPRDEHLLTIAIEDQRNQSYQLAYVADEQGSAISSRAEVHGYHVGRQLVAVRPHGYKTAMGDPSLPPEYRATYSQFLFGIPLTRPSWGLFAKLFLALFIAVALSMVGLLLRSASEGLAAAGTALFIEVVNAECIAPLIPETGESTLADTIGGIAYLTTGIVFLQCILSKRLLPDISDEANARASEWFDWLTFVALLIGYLAVNFGLFSVS